MKLLISHAYSSATLFVTTDNSSVEKMTENYMKNESLIPDSFIHLCQSVASDVLLAVQE